VPLYLEWAPQQIFDKPNTKKSAKKVDTSDNEGEEVSEEPQDKEGIIHYQHKVLHFRP
jgi:hypothetical protein